MISYSTTLGVEGRVISYSTTLGVGGRVIFCLTTTCVGGEIIICSTTVGVGGDTFCAQRRRCDTSVHGGDGESRSTTVGVGGGFCGTCLTTDRVEGGMISCFPAPQLFSSRRWDIVQWCQRKFVVSDWSGGSRSYATVMRGNGRSTNLTSGGICRSSQPGGTCYWATSAPVMLCSICTMGLRLKGLFVRRLVSVLTLAGCILLIDSMIFSYFVKHGS